MIQPIKQLSGHPLSTPAVLFALLADYALGGCTDLVCRQPGWRAGIWNGSRNGRSASTMILATDNAITMAKARARCCGLRFIFRGFTPLGTGH